MMRDNIQLTFNSSSITKRGKQFQLNLDYNNEEVALLTLSIFKNKRID